MQDNLTDILLSENCRPTDVLSFLQSQYSARREYCQSYDPQSVVNIMPPTEFFSETDWPEYLRLMQTWKDIQAQLDTKIPPVHAAPTLIQLCFNYWDGSTLLGRLNARVHSLRTWYAEALAEIAPKRKGQRGTVGGDVRAARGKGAATASTAVAAAKAYQNYLAVCAERRTAMSVWAERVEEARQAWVMIKEGVTPPLSEPALENTDSTSDEASDD